MELREKLSILADAAKYDASCASSGSHGRRAARGGMGSTESMGICHSYTPDGRCVSLLKILLTNYCLYDCSYCINRRSSGVQRARFTPAEVVWLTLEFYRRNYIEGLFLSSGIVKGPDYTMEQLVTVARMLRVQRGFGGYIHLKVIPNAAPELVAEAGRYADRLSVNIELPRQGDLDALAPDKELTQIRRAMSHIREEIVAAPPLAAVSRAGSTLGEPNESGPAFETAPIAAPDRASEPRRALTSFAPAGQSTQMIVGASAASDAVLLDAAAALYAGPRLKRVYYSAFSPIPDASPTLPSTAPPLVREHRLYQADWLMRYYGFGVRELTTPEAPNLELAIDPKLAWALRNRDRFPVDLNVAPREDLLRVPGIGVRSVNRILSVRRWSRIRVDDLARLRVALGRALPFIQVADHTPHRFGLDALDLRERVAPAGQLDLFAAARSAHAGEL